MNHPVITGCPGLLKVRVPHMRSCPTCMRSRNDALKAFQRMLEIGELQQLPELCPEMENFISSHKHTCVTCQEITLQAEKREKASCGSLSNQEILEAAKKSGSGSKKRCSFPVRSECSPKIISAHSVQLKQLEKIARDAHVYHFKGGYDNLLRNNGVFISSPVGIKQGSTFSGFCEHHDDSLFAKIEKGYFSIDQEQCFLFAYRSICFELFNQEIALELFQTHKQLDRSFPWELQLVFQMEIDADEKKQEWALRGLQSVKSDYDEVLRNENFCEMNFYAVEIDSILPFLWSGVSSPQWDFEGHEIQTFSEFETPLVLSCSSVVIGGHTWVIFVWLGRNVSIMRFIKSFDMISDSELVEAVRRYVFELVENTYFDPEWWENNPVVQKFLEERIMRNFKNRFRGLSDQLVSDGYRFLSGKVVSRKIKMV